LMGRRARVMGTETNVTGTRAASLQHNTTDD